MVSSGQVNSDSSVVSSLFSNYNTSVNELSSSWKGASYNNFVAKANEFSSEYSSSVQEQMTFFATACSLYEQYKTAKKNLQISKENYNIAVNNNDSSNTSLYSGKINEYTEKMNSLKSEIESNLSQVSSKKLEASTANLSISSSSDSVELRQVSSGVQGALDWAITTASDDAHGYSQNTRWGNPNYDCSSFVITAYQEAGIPVKDAGATYTGNMKNAFVSCGFTWIPGNPNVEDLQPGDVLLDEGSHTEMYVGNGKNVGAHSNYDGGNGDSSGKEICVKDYYSHPWDGVLRYTENQSDDNSDLNH